MNAGRGGRFISLLLGLVLGFVVVGCEKPKLRSELDDPSEEPPTTSEPAPEISEPSYLVKRKAVIGQSFATLTLGARRFLQATVTDINDKGIVLAHVQGVETIPWGEVTDRVRDEWGFNPKSNSLSKRLTDFLPDRNETPNSSSSIGNSSKMSDSPPAKNSAFVTVEIEKRKEMLNAQLAGIRRLEADLSREGQKLNQLRSNLNAVRARQSGQRSGGIRVERINGESTLIDREKEAREIQSQIRAQEPFVAQLTQSLQTARQRYQEIKAEMDQLILE